MNENSECYYTQLIKPKNTVLLVEPRRILYTFVVLKNAYDILKDDWHYVFYCGKSVYNEWLGLVPPYVELRALHCDDLANGGYNDYFKTRQLWESLDGEFILTIQLDAWILNEYPYTIDYFLKQDKSFIGGSMPYSWKEFQTRGVYLPFNNLNGGLSLRKRADMITVIDYMSSLNDKSINSLGEDVYLSLGCYKLNMKIGDDETTNNFAVHHVYQDSSFGIHCIYFPDMQDKIWERYPTLLSTNPYIFVYGHIEAVKYKQEICDDIDITESRVWQPFVGNVLLHSLLKRR